MKKSTFKQLGGHPILDFCNTLLIHRDSIKDDLIDPKSGEAFYEAFFSLKEKFTLKQHQELIHLRNIIRDYFESLITVKENNSLHHLNKWIKKSEILPQVELDQKISFSLNKKSKSYLPIINSFFSFLPILDKSRLKRCSNPNCSHLFIDKSKNNQRHWCSMKSCGNIMKARAFKARQKCLKEV
jgi:predicted RNA-binding Zn ribbon-like protein